MGTTMTSICFTVILASLSHLAVGNLQVEVGGLRIESPQRKREMFDMALANFGLPKYGGRLTGRVAYTSNGYMEEDHECTSGCEYGCEAFDEAKPPIELQGVDEGVVLLIDRGPVDDPDDPDDVPACNFVDKVWHAQNAGASGVILVNYANAILNPREPLDQAAPDFVKNITIPAGFVSSIVGNVLKDILKNNQDLVVTMDWTDSIPKQEKVEWEFWTNSNDNCGNNCELQRQFIKDYVAIAQELEEGNYTSFRPHFVSKTCDELRLSVCPTNCIRNGRYCAHDPDFSTYSGFEGRDIVMEDIRQLCLHKLGVESGKPWIWWEYAAIFWDRCPVSTGKYGSFCSESVFDDVGGPSLKDGNGFEEWKKCIDEDNADLDEPINLLENERRHRLGIDESTGAVNIVPTIRVNGDPYKGTLTAPSVMRAICSGFHTGSEAPICNRQWVSENECGIGQVGYVTCNNSTNTENKTTKCKNTFSGFECVCADGYSEVEEVRSGKMCLDDNECLTRPDVIAKLEECGCERCACHNLPGSFRCESGIINECDDGNGGCWEDTINGKRYTACVDKIQEYKKEAASGTANSKTPLYECQCPPCFTMTNEGTCEPLCDLEACEQAGGDCALDLLNRDNSRNPKTGKGGLSIGGMIGIIIAVLVVAIALIFVVYKRLRGQMRSDLNFYVTQYMPFNEDKAATIEAPRAAQDGNVIQTVEHRPSDIGL